MNGGSQTLVVCYYIRVTTSRKIESDRDCQKNKERVQELKILWKQEKLHSTISEYIETFATKHDYKLLLHE